MRYLLVLGVFSATTLTYAKDVVCPAGKSNSQVAVEAGDTIGYQTQAGATYEKNTNCVTKFTLDNSCKKIKFSCDSFNLGKGDLMIVKIGKKSKKFKGKKFKKPIVSTKTTLITFKSNKKKEGPGALCSMECIKSAATAAPTPPPTTGVPVCENCVLQSEFCTQQDCNVYITGIFAIWVSKEVDFSSNAETFGNWLEIGRKDLLANYDRKDPPNVDEGIFFNIYYHGEGVFLKQFGFGNGVGTNKFGLPFMTLAGLRKGVLLHELHHVLTYKQKWGPDSRWYIESSAHYFASHYDDTYKTENAGVFFIAPFLSLWIHPFYSQAPYDPEWNAGPEGRYGWMYSVRHYASQVLLNYLEQKKGVPKSIISKWIEPEQYPNYQTYWFNELGHNEFRNYYADFAAEVSADYNFFTREQYKEALRSIDVNGDWAYSQASVWTSVDQGTNGEWVRPQQNFTSRGWAWNVFNITNTGSQTYKFKLKGDPYDNSGEHESFFFGKIVTMGSNGNHFYDMTMESPLEGNFDIAVTGDVTRVLFVIVSLPDYLGGYETYGYEVNIEHIPD